MVKDKSLTLQNGRTGPYWSINMLNNKINFELYILSMSSAREVFVFQNRLFIINSAGTLFQVQKEKFLLLRNLPTGFSNKFRQLQGKMLLEKNVDFLSQTFKHLDELPLLEVGCFFADNVLMMAVLNQVIFLSRFTKN